MPQQATTDTHADREFAFTQRDFDFLTQLVHEVTGIVLAEHKRDMVYGRLARRLRQLKLADFSAYCALLSSPQGADEISQLTNAITTNLTAFFRESHHFEHLESLVRSRLDRSASNRWRIWSAGCSSGMEPYSIAMTLLSAIPQIERQDVRILATDIDTNMLARGRAGQYAAKDAQSIPPRYHNLFRSLGNGQIEMDARLRGIIRFNPLNLLDSWPMRGPFDAIFCRNVVIYFDRDTQKRLFARIAQLLPIGGILYVGHSENLSRVSQQFESCGRTIYRRVS